MPTAIARTIPAILAIPTLYSVVALLATPLFEQGIIPKQIRILSKDFCVPA
jgi:hypothetical protein